MRLVFWSYINNLRILRVNMCNLYKISESRRLMLPIDFSDNKAGHSKNKTQCPLENTYGHEKFFVQYFESLYFSA